MNSDTNRYRCEAFFKFLLFLPLLFVLLFNFSCSKKTKNFPEVVRPVKTLKTQEASNERERSFSGIAKAELEINLSFRVSGSIVALKVKVGEKVKKGDLIASLDPTDYEVEVKQREAQLAEAEAQLTKFRSDYDRSRLLYEANNISISELDKDRALFESSLAQKDAAKKQLQLSQLRLDYCQLHAPITGAIVKVPIEIHQTVAAGQEIVTLSSSKKMEMELGIPESLISQIQVGDPVSIEFESFSGQIFPGKVSEVGIETTESTTYPVIIHLLRKDSRIRSGMVGEATFTFKSASGKAFILLPPVAVVGAPGKGRFLWVYQPQTQSVTKRNVQVGDLTSTGLEIKSGLQAGEIVVIRGVHRLEEGMKVKLLNE